MKNKIISIITIVVVGIAIIVAVKSKGFNLSKNNNNEIIQTDDSTEESGVQEYEDYTIDKMQFVNVGEEGTYERIVKTASGNDSPSSIRYQFKYIDCEITKEKPEGIEINIFNEKEQETDSEGTFVDDTYYVTVTYEVTNKMEDGWNNDGFYPQNFMLGYYDDKFNSMYEPNGFTVTGTPAISGVAYIEKDQSIVVKSLYCVKQSVLDTGKAVVQVQVLSENKAINMPYFVINAE